MSKVRLVGIAGGTASGKSWLAAFVKARLGGRAALLSQDWYYKDQSGAAGTAKKRLNFDHPRAIEHGLLIAHLDALRGGRAIQAPQYVFATHARAPRTVPVPAAPVVIVEGLFVLQQKGIRSRLDHSVYVDVPADVRLMRRLRRDAAERGIPAEETLRLYESFARPMHERFVEPSAAFADSVWQPLRDAGFPRRFAAEIQEHLLSKAA